MGFGEFSQMEGEDVEWEVQESEQGVVTLVSSEVYDKIDAGMDFVPTRLGAQDKPQDQLNLLMRETVLVKTGAYQDQFDEQGSIIRPS